MKAEFRYCLSVQTISRMLFLLLCLSSASTLSAHEWELAKDKNEIQVYTKKSDNSKLKDSKVVSLVDASVDAILKELMDFETYPDWIPTCKESKVLEKISETELIYYSEYKAPWPVANRDMIIHLKVEKDELTGVVTMIMNARPEYIPAKDKIVRISEFVGSWTLTPVDGGKVEAINEYHTHPGGSIPEWLANMTAVDNPFKTMANLKSRLADK